MLGINRFVGLMIAFGSVAASSQAGEGILLIDDFRSDQGISAVGTRWAAFTDRVMGGISSGRAIVVDDETTPYLRLEGDVSLANNGGFVQVALPLSPQGHAIDASAFVGLRLRVRGNGEEYAIHLRTDDCRLPWQYYEAPFETDDDWTTIEISFTDFDAASLDETLDPSRLRRIGLVASKKAMRAEVELARIELFR